MVYILVPQALINGEVGFALLILATIFLSATGGTIMVLQFLIEPLSHYLLELKYGLQRLCGSRRGSQHKSIVYKNMESNSRTNRNIGVTFMALIVLALQVLYLNSAFSQAVNSEILMAAGGDFIVAMYDQTQKSHPNNQARVHKASGGYAELPTVHKKSMDAVVEAYRKDHPFIQDYCYVSYSLGTIMDNFANIYNPHADLDFVWTIKNSVQELGFAVTSGQRNMMEVTTAANLQMAELWQPPSLNKHYEGPEIFDLLYAVSENKALSSYTRNPDPSGILLQDK